VYDGKMWAVNGAHAYWSIDGVHWNTPDPDPDGVTPFDGRVGVTALAFAKPGEGNRLWLIGGYLNNGARYWDEVWSST
jgi:hypothetical protein